MDIITLTTDFGYSDGFVGAMKGRIYSILKKYNRRVEIVDICHNVRPFNIYNGAYVLLTSIPYYPPSVHIAVIDPTVGSERNSIVVKLKNGSYIVAPDNGLVSYVVNRIGIDKIYRIDETKYSPSSTFHGRDVYAVVGAEIVAGIFEGEEIDKIVKLDDTKKRVIHIDRFGNIITNIKRDEINFKLYDYIKIKFKTKKGEKIIKCKFVKSYFEGGNEFICLINSEGFLEIAKFMDNAANLLDVDYLDEVEICNQ
ncbi:SAM hydrolase/SAM-dependent halogenase family protein [Methanocaldococcus indicus]|uniref:SAM hydrolase/SAM-dependent halogenase family protein n=1 Tax=Methanocaldococcus indicus TaxID=213231 RepID=UPI003C6D7DAF